MLKRITYIIFVCFYMSNFFLNGLLWCDQLILPPKELIHPYTQESGGSDMGIKRHWPEEIETKFRQVEVLVVEALQIFDTIDI